MQYIYVGEFNGMIYYILHYVPELLLRAQI